MIGMGDSFVRWPIEWGGDLPRQQLRQTDLGAAFVAGHPFVMADAEGQRMRMSSWFYLPVLILSRLRLAAPCCASCSVRRILLADELSFADVEPSASWPRGGLRSAQARFF